MFPARSFLAGCLSVFAATGLEAESFLKPADVVALVGGQDLVVAGEMGFLERAVVRGLPDAHVRFRSLAWEGDTVFEQRRDLNFPALAEQLDLAGATVVVCQFGQMECLRDRPRADTSQHPVSFPEDAEYAAAYEKLLRELAGGGRRRVVCLAAHVPAAGASPAPADYAAKLAATNGVSAGAAARSQAAFIYVNAALDRANLRGTDLTAEDGIHLSVRGQQVVAGVVADWLLGRSDQVATSAPPPEDEPLLKAIRAKNRLWFHYWRPQNWAFLRGDRINQPSSRDHLDPSKRWFPAEMEEFKPLIAAREEEIDRLAVGDRK